MGFDGLENDKQHHQLGDAGRVSLGIGVVFKKDFSRGGIDDNGTRIRALGNDFQCRRSRNGAQQQQEDERGDEQQLCFHEHFLYSAFPFDGNVRGV